MEKVILGGTFRQPLTQPLPYGASGKESACQCKETWARSLGWEDPLEEGVATHSSVLAWRVPWTEEPGGLQSLGSQSRTRPSDLARRQSPGPGPPGCDGDADQPWVGAHLEPTSGSESLGPKLPCTPVQALCPRVWDTEATE